MPTQCPLVTPPVMAKVHLGSLTFGAFLALFRFVGVKGPFFAPKTGISSKDPSWTHSNRAQTLYLSC